MVTRLYEGDKNETGGTGIEVTSNKVINLILRSLNNLIHVNDNNEVYVDLQLEDGIADDDTLPIGVNVGRVLAADGRPVTGTLISGQTTSGDWVKFLYGDDGNIYVDNGTGTFTMLGNVKAFYLASTSDITTAQAIYDWYAAGKYPIVYYDNNTYLLQRLQPTGGQYYTLYFLGPKLVEIEDPYMTSSDLTQTAVQIFLLGDQVTSISTVHIVSAGFLSVDKDYRFAYMPQYDGSPATKKYVDSRVVIDTTAPATPEIGQFWYNTTNSTLSLYDGTQRLSI